jgi:hypothetical protein
MLKTVVNKYTIIVENIKEFLIFIVRKTLRTDKIGDKIILVVFWKLKT